MFDAGQLHAHVDEVNYTVIKAKMLLLMMMMMIMCFWCANKNFTLANTAAAMTYSKGPGAGGVGSHIGKIAIVVAE